MPGDTETHSILALVIVIAATCLIAYLVRWLLLLVMKYYAKKVDSHLLKSLRKRLTGLVFLFIPFTVLYFFIDSFGLDQGHVEVSKEVLKVLIIVSAVVVLVRLINVVQDLLFHQFNIDEEDNLKARQARTQILFLKKLCILVVVIVGASIILLSFESVRKYGATLLTSAGVAGIIIGFAAQKTIGNLLAGFQIAFTQPIKIDDAVIVEGEWGWIEEINLTYVVVKIWDLRRLILPITYFTEKSFQNWTRTSAQILGSVFLYTDYTLPVDAVREKFDTILESTDLWDGEVKNVQVTDTSEQTMTLRFLMTAKNSPTAWDLRCLVRERLIAFIQQSYPECLSKSRVVLTGKE